MYAMKHIQSNSKLLQSLFHTYVTDSKKTNTNKLIKFVNYYFSECSEHIHFKSKPAEDWFIDHTN